MIKNGKLVEDDPVEMHIRGQLDAYQDVQARMESDNPDWSSVYNYVVQMRTNCEVELSK